ncbi:MAG TPA: spermidine/putrescine ABC transporter substrate-binding protein [Verrucomicrobiae bacterium]|nr:spermidine/putrescine ABC transporter substrate-binding protein [Verrucomicrobiae bacterium]
MYKRFIVIVVSLLVTASAWAQKNKLNVFIWSEYIDPKIIDQFSKEYDCKVTVDLYEDNESMMAKLEGGGDSLYDICVPSDYIIPALIKNGLLAPLRKENIPNMKNLDPKFANREYDPGNKYTAPYQWGTVGLFVRKKAGETIDETWGLVFDAKKQIGSFLIIDDARAAIGAALKYKGYSLNCTDKKQLKEARDVLIDAKKRSLGFEGGVGIKNKVLAKVCRIGMVYNGDAVRGMKEDPETYYFVPREGSEIWLDNMAVPAKAPNRDMAEKFINYILDAKIGAQLSNFNQYATPNEAALEFISPADLKNPAIYPPPDVMKTLEFVKDLGAKTGWYDELWTGIKSK